MIGQLDLAPTTLVWDGRRRQGWRAILRGPHEVLWRCSCRPHATQALAFACGNASLNRRDSGFYQGRDFMGEFIEAPTTDEARAKFVANMGVLVDTARLPAADVLRELDQYLASITSSVSYEDIRTNQHSARSIRELFIGHQEVRQRAEHVFLMGEWNIAQKLSEQPVSVGGRPRKTGDATSQVSKPATLTELVGNRFYANRLKQLLRLDREGMESAIYQLHREGPAKEATLNGVTKLIGAEDTRVRRMDTLTAPRIPYSQGYDYRIGDARLALADVEDESIPLIITDPPYGDEAEPLYRWLAAYAARVLVPGGSLICYTGQSTLIRDGVIFGEHLKYWWTNIMLHDAAQRLAGKFVIPGFKPILWFVKGFRRGRSLVSDVVSDEIEFPDIANILDAWDDPSRLLMRIEELERLGTAARSPFMADVARPQRDKSAHDWGQGDGGVRRWIHHLTDPGETIVEPFCGEGKWGRIACEEGRYWKGADIAFGGTTTIAANDLTQGGNDEGRED